MSESVSSADLTGAPRVALLDMPMAPATRPSIQLGILRALLDEAGLESLEFHGCLDFFEVLVRNRMVSQSLATSSSLLSEWYFSEGPLDYEHPTASDRAALGFLKQATRATGFPLEKMRTLREELVPAFLDRLADEIVASGVSVACFTLSYAQRNASFALARRLKERSPHLLTVFGGAASQVFEESCREYLRVFPGVDCMVLGEAEGRFAPLVEALLAGRPVAHIPGIVCRGHLAGASPSAGEPGSDIHCTGPEPPPVDVARLPVPAFGGWFERAGRMSRTVRAYLESVVPLEIGRGCTWADHAPCRFCAFTFQGRYRAKSLEQVVREVQVQRDRCGTSAFYLVDNVVPERAIRSLLPAMREAVPDLAIPFVEVLTTLRRPDLEILAASGVTLVQAGTECFDDGLLRRIGKGTTTFHNVRFLGQAREAGIGVSHNILLGVPQATPEEIDSQRGTLELLFHLDPPQPLELQLVRFSEYCEKPAQFGLENLRPHPFCAATLPPGADPSRVAYEFVAEHGQATRLPYAPTLEVLHRWRLCWSLSPPPYLIHDFREDGVEVLDGRERPGHPVTHRLDGMAAALYALLLEAPLRADAAARRVAEDFPGGDVGDVQRILDDLASRRLLLGLQGRWMALSLAGDRLRRGRSDLPGRLPG